MTAIIDNQVVSCLAEMERLQEKIKALNKEKQERAATKEKKIRDTEPNMAVLEKWLENKEQVEYDKVSKKAKEDYEKFTTRRSQEQEKYRQERYNLPESERMENYRDPTKRVLEQKKRKNEEEKRIEGMKIWENYQKYHNPPETRRRGHVDGNRPVYIERPIQETFQGPFMKDFIEATHNLFQIQQKRIDELEIKLQAQHHTPRQLEYMAHKRASRFKAHLAEKIHTGSPEQYKGCGGSCAICLEDMTSGGMCYKLNTGGMEHVFHRVCGEQQM